MTPPKKILVVKLSAIGDVILALPTFTALKRLTSESHVTLLVGEAAAPLIDNHPDIDDRIIVDENIFWRKRWKPLISLFWRLKHKKFDAVYILHWSRWFHIFFWLMGIPERIGFKREGNSFRLTRAAPYTEGAVDTHEVQQYLRLIDDRFLLESSDLRPRLYFSAAESSKIADWIQRQEFPKDRACIAMAPGGGHNAKLFMPQKRWPAARYAALLKQLVVEEGAYVVLVGDASEKDLLMPWLNLISIKDYCNAAGILSLRQTALIIQKCKLFIGNDSGLLHLAGAVSTPSLSFFGPTSPNGKLPVWTIRKYLYTQESCSPCYKYGQAPPCPYDLKCLHHISTDEALTAARSLLAESRLIS